MFNKILLKIYFLEISKGEKRSMAFTAIKEIIMLNKILTIIYFLEISKGEKRIPYMENYLNITEYILLSEDDFRNESDVYKEFFSKKNNYAEIFYNDVLNKINGSDYSSCHDALDALKFFQGISSIALWKYNLDINKIIEYFVRDFDRLDIYSERIRLYNSIQKIP